MTTSASVRRGSVVSAGPNAKPGGSSTRIRQESGRPPGGPKTGDNGLTGHTRSSRSGVRPRRPSDRTSRVSVLTSGWPAASMTITANRKRPTWLGTPHRYGGDPAFGGDRRGIRRADRAVSARRYSGSTVSNRNCLPSNTKRNFFSVGPGSTRAARPSASVLTPSVRTRLGNATAAVRPY